MNNQSEGKPVFMPTNMAKIRCNNDNIFVKWLTLTYNLHKLTDKEIDVAALFLKYYHQNKANIINDDVLNSVTFSAESKRKIRQELGMTPTYFQIILKGLRSKNFYKDNKINPVCIPNFNKDGNILLLYVLKNESVPDNSIKV